MSSNCRVPRSCVAGVLFTISSAASVTFPASATADGFRDVLATAEIGAEQFELFADWDGQWTADHEHVAAEVLNLLDRFDASQLDAWTAAASEALTTDALPGQLTWIDGLATSCAESGKYQKCEVATEQGVRLLVWTVRVPKQWKPADAGQKMSEPVRLRGVDIGTSSADGEPAKLVLTDWIQWRPLDNVPTGWLALSRAGMDVALLDEIRQRQPFVSPQISREGEAFYAMLAAAARFRPVELVAGARNEIAQRKPQWQQIVDASVDVQSEAGRRRASIAHAVLVRGELGLSSVAPLFLMPEQEVGRLAVIDGTARRAVKIAAAASIASSDQREPTDYYEIEVFTADSDNMPVVCCVASLPAGFPIGDAIREPVRVAGFFFKSWVYRSRKPADPNEKRSHRNAYAPIMVAPAPIWNRPAVATESNWGLWAGVGFLISLAIVSAILWQLGRRDRRARRRNVGAEVTLPKAT